MVTLRIPAPPAGLLSNLVGLVGLATICVAVALLTDWRWGVLAGGVACVGLAVLAQAGAQQEPAQVRPIRPKRTLPKSA